MPSYTVGFHTLGCKVSQYESEAMAEDFERRGFAVLSFEDVCDVYVINTCTVTAESDRKSRQMVRRAHRKNPDALIIVCGCSTQRNAMPFEKINGVAYISGSDGKMKLAARTLELLAERPLSPVVEVMPLDGASFESMSICRAPRTRAYVKIEDGCECRCAYCAIPDARGPVRSKPREEVIREVETLVRGGSREIVLTGIETASYGAEFDGYKLIDLIEELDGTAGLERIRLGSLTPEVIRGDFVERIAKIKTIAPHFHLSVQSGCSKTLAAMRRRYNADMALGAIQALRDAIPGAMFTCDIMVGFPGETDEDFLESCEFVRRARFLDMHVFAYSKREGTPAAVMKDQVPEDVKHERSAKLIALGEKIKAEILDEVVKAGKELRVLFETEHEGVSHGHTDSFIEAKAEIAGVQSRLATVVPVSHDGKALLCRVKVIHE